MMFVDYVEIKVQKANPIIEAINLKNSKIKTFYCDDIKIKAIKKLTVNLKGKIYFEKDKNFRMFTSSILGKESDIGSNDNQFWFWSRKMNPPALHYAKYEDIYKTRLKTPFHPIWTIECLGILPFAISSIASLVNLSLIRVLVIQIVLNQNI